MPSRRQSDGKARLLLALLTLTGIGLQVIPFLLVPPATLELLLRDEVFGSIAEKEARVVYGGEEGEGGTSVQILAEPAGSIARVPRIPSGPGNVVVHVDGYQPASLDIRPEPLTVLRADLKLVPTFGRIEVTTVDARNANRPVPAGLTVAGRKVEAQPNGVVVVDVPPKTYQLEAHPNEGFCPAQGQVTVKEREITKVRLPISPVVGGDQVARFVLDWGESPRDLDAHLNLSETTVGLTAPQVYYLNKRGVTAAGTVFANLDVDHLNSEGFETVTVYHQVPGTYQYFVHQYSSDGALKSSGATVELITKGCVIQRFQAPTDCTERWWHVVDLEVSQQGVNPIVRGECVDAPGSNWGRRRKQS